MTSCCLTAMTLAASGDWIEIVVYGIGTVIVVGGWIANQISQLRAEQERRRKIAELEGAEPDRATGRESTLKSTMKPLPTQAELARRRREQLAALSRRRRSPGHGATRGGASREQPANLSPAEKTQRERAREAYERRARQLREQREQKEREQQAARSRYEQELARRRERAEQARRERQLQQQARHQAQQQARRPGQRSSRPAPRAQPSRPVMPTPVMDTPRRQPAARGRTAVARPMPALLAPRQARPAAIMAAYDLANLDLDALRRAIVLKEVLDQPVALRDPMAGVPGLA